MNILLIEPDRILAKTYQKALQQAGHIVHLSTTAQSAIYNADKHAPDLIVLELQLVSHSGVEFLYEFRSYPEWQSTPVIVVSNVPPGEFSDSWDVLKDQLGVVAYRYKPRTSLKTLIRVVDEFATIKS